MGRIEIFPAIQPMPAVARILSRYDRQKLEAFLAIAIDLLDTMDGDTDVEVEEPEEDDPLEQDDPAEDDDEDCCPARDDGAHYQSHARPCGPLVTF